MAGTNQVLSFNWPRYPNDKIFISEDDATISVSQNASALAPSFTSVAIPHSVGQNFFLELQTSPDGLIWYDSGNEPWYYNGTFMSPFPRFLAYWQVSGTNITLFFTANDNSYTMHYRYVGFLKE